MSVGAEVSVCCRSIATACILGIQYWASFSAMVILSFGGRLMKSDTRSPDAEYLSSSCENVARVNAVALFGVPFFLPPVFCLAIGGLMFNNVLRI